MKRCSSTEEQLSLLPSVIKSFQDEINQLTRRSKLAENAFLNCYKIIYQAPDPTPILQQAQVKKSKEIKVQQQEQRIEK